MGDPCWLLFLPHFVFAKGLSRSILKKNKTYKDNKGLIEEAINGRKKAGFWAPWAGDTKLALMMGIAPASEEDLMLLRHGRRMGQKSLWVSLLCRQVAQVR
jgi:hypothetical protein